MIIRRTFITDADVNYYKAMSNDDIKKMLHIDGYFDDSSFDNDDKWIFRPISAGIPPFIVREFRQSCAERPSLLCMKPAGQN